jgi:aspartyl-tRNA(Asn)/glutamyl-tRNA(Gln) amidotransferase subunit A
MLGPFESISRLSQAIQRREVSSVELTRMYLTRLKTLGREYRAVAEITEERALAEAKSADEHLKKTGKPKSILHGIPYGAKDLLATKGIPTRWGSPGHQEQVFDYDATVIEKLTNAGAVLVAKLSMIELAGGGGYNTPSASADGACLCAWDKTRWAGGSSSGSGTATALGCVAFSLGSETSGSITCPSAFNGICGFRPTYGRVSRFGAMPLCWTLDKIGPMARSAEDCALVLSLISGYDPRDPSSLREPLNLRYRGPKLRVGILPEEFEKNEASECQKAYDEALRVFQKIGYSITEVKYPDLPYEAALVLIIQAEGASAHENFIRSERFWSLADKEQLAGLASGLEVRAVDYLWALRIRTEALQANIIWEKCDCLFTPVFYHSAPPVEEKFEKSFQKMGGDVGPSNLLGWPALAFPIGRENGAPLGGQIIAPAFREDICYEAVRMFQRETDWHLQRPVKD